MISLYENVGKIIYINHLQLDTLILKNTTILRIATLKSAFNFDSCMVEGCSYNTTYDVHRFVHGKHGGEYVIGNMFAICPNHHAEIHRGIMTVEKVNNYTLRSVY